jgi:uncharacterized membrane protein
MVFLSGVLAGAVVMAGATPAPAATMPGRNGVDLLGWTPGGRLWVVDGYAGPVSMRPDGGARRPVAWPIGAFAFSPDSTGIALAERGSVWTETMQLERRRRLFRYKDDLVTSIAWARR